MSWVFGVDARFDRVPFELDVGLGDGEDLTCGDPDLPFDQVQPFAVDADDLFGDGMLHLETGVHFHEEELVRGLVGDQKLHGAGADIVHRTGGVNRRRADPCPDFGAVGQALEQRRGCFLDDLLVPALQGALTLAQVDGVAVTVGEDLDLDVPGGADQSFQEQRVVAEGALGDAPGGFQGGRQILGPLHHVHALAATTG